MIAASLRDVSRLNRFMRFVLMVGVLSITSTFAAAKDIHWKEQVRLSSGEVIVVERGESLRSVYDGGPLRPGWLFDEAWLKGNLPGVGETTWQGALSPLVLDVTAHGEWYLLAIVRTLRGEREYKLASSTRYVAFKLQAGVWQRIPFAEFPEQFLPNLLGNTSRLFQIDETPSGTMVDFEMKHKVDSVRNLDAAYKRIDRSLGARNRRTRAVKGFVRSRLRWTVSECLEVQRRDDSLFSDHGSAT